MAHCICTFETHRELVMAPVPDEAKTRFDDANDLDALAGDNKVLNATVQLRFKTPKLFLVFVQ
eukprot:4638084-Amphidinium_carterae.2